jgi:hypothetical protein
MQMDEKLTCNLACLEMDNMHQAHLKKVPSSQRGRLDVKFNRSRDFLLWEYYIFSPLESSIWSKFFFWQNIIFWPLKSLQTQWVELVSVDPQAMHYFKPPCNIFSIHLQLFNPSFTLIIARGRFDNEISSPAKIWFLVEVLPSHYKQYCRHQLVVCVLLCLKLDLWFMCKCGHCCIARF